MESERFVRSVEVRQCMRVTIRGDVFITVGISESSWVSTISSACHCRSFALFHFALSAALSRLCCPNDEVATKILQRR